MSPNGVRDFVQGAMPRGATRLKVERWLVSQGRIARPPNVGQFVRLLNELAGDLSPTQAVQMGRHLAALLVESRSEEHTSELQSQSNLVCRLLLEKKKMVNKVIQADHLLLKHLQ